MLVTENPQVALQRKEIIAEREKVSLEEQQQAERVILQKVTHTSEFRSAKNIACYLPIRGEVLTQQLILAIWQQQKTCYLPIMQSNKTLQFAEYDATSTLIQNQHRILEPRLSEKHIAPKDLDLVIVPVVAFEGVSHARLGYGAGYYDATFSFLLDQPHTKPYLIGIAYDFQRLSQIVQQPWDVPLHKIVTPTATYEAGLLKVENDGE